MTLRDCVETYGLDCWLCHAKEPKKKLLKVEEVVVDSDYDFVVLAKLADGKYTGLRMKAGDPQDNFVSWGGS